MMPIYFENGQKWDKNVTVAKFGNNMKTVGNLMAKKALVDIDAKRNIALTEESISLVPKASRNDMFSLLSSIHTFSHEQTSFRV